MRARFLAALTEMRAIHTAAGDAAFTADQQAAFDALRAERETLAASIAAWEAREQVFVVTEVRGRGQVEEGDGAARNALGEGDGYDRDPIGDPRDADPVGGRNRGGNPWDLSRVQAFGRPAEAVARELSARAVSAAGRMPGSTDRQRAVLVRMLQEQDNERADLARHVLIASDPEYLAAFSKGLRGQMWDLTDGEKRAMRAASELARAMSLTDAAGGYLIPQQLDPALILTADGSVNPFRELATKKVGTSDVWNGVSTTHAAWSYDAEAAEVSDDATTFAQPPISLYTARGFIPISIEGLAYEPNVTGTIAMVLAGGKDDLEASTFATGTGSSQPFGIVTAVTAGALASTTTDTFAIGDVYKLPNALPDRYLDKATWVANKAIYNLIRQFDTSGGAGLWEYLGGGLPPELLGSPTRKSSAMDGTITATATNLVLLLGDFSYYYIVDRMGMVVETIPHLFHTGNNRPSGQRGFLAYCMHGADSVNDSAFELLDVT
jgi:HK97 family phage major capsid protein